MNEEIRKEKMNKPKGRIIFSVFTTLFCLIIGFLSLCGIFVPDREMSENENRVLASMPLLTLSGLTDGSFMKDFEAYLSDQFPFRDEAIYIKSFVERLWGKRQENGVYIGKDGFLFDEPARYNEAEMKAIAKSVKEFAEKNKKLRTVFALVPNSSYVYSEYLPDGLVTESQKNQIEGFYSELGKGITTVDAVSALLSAKAEQQVFYKTDHHWTTRGAYSVFLQIADKLELKTKADDFEFHTVSTDFEGTLKAKSLSSLSVDSVEICIPKKSQGTYFVEISGVDKKYSSLFFEDKLDARNKYEVFLGGNYERVTVTTSLPEGRKLLVIKDSYANCMLPMLTPYFTEITVLDPRYMTSEVEKVLQEDDFTDILFLYNANTFFADKSLEAVL